MITSPLKRCTQSAALLRQDKQILADPIFGEPDLPHPSWRFPKLPLSVWGVLFRLAWFCGFSSNAESVSDATARARSAAERLTNHSTRTGAINPRQPVNSDVSPHFSLASSAFFSASSGAPVLIGSPLALAQAARLSWLAGRCAF